MRARDVGTVMVKEMRELMDSLTGGSRAQLIAMGFIGLFFGVVTPMRQGAAWFSNATTAFSYAFIGMVLLMGPIADVFAGERERHTLETLLSTRLDDSSILIGKLLGVLVPAWLATAFIYLVAIVATNVEYGHGHLLLPPLWSAGATLATIVLVPGLMAAIGINTSMRANTVRKAAQLLSLFVMALVFVPVIASRALPHAWVVWLIGTLEGHTPAQVGLAIGAGLLVLDLGIVALALARFRRGRLALD